MLTRDILAANAQLSGILEELKAEGKLKEPE